jgi:SP family galactose:H+ symporter-like MFS transporter
MPLGVETYTELLDSLARNPRMLTLYLSYLSFMGGGFFGYSLGLVAGAYSSFEAEFKYKVTHLSVFGAPLVISFIASAVMVGAFVGSLIGGPLAEWIGRRYSMMLVVVWATFGTIFATAVPVFEVVIIARFVQGVATGAVSCICPIYVVEMSPPDKRGVTSGFFQIGFIIWLVFSYLMGLAFTKLEHAWQGVMGMQGVVILLLAIAVTFMPESRPWLDKQHKAHSSKHTVHVPVWQRMAENAILFSKWRNVKAFFLGWVISVAAPLTGVLAVTFFTPVVLFESGWKPLQVYGATLGIGVVELIGAFISIIVVDRLGRKPLMIVGLAMCGSTMIICGFVYKFAKPSAHAPVYIALVMIYVIGFNIGIGSLMFVLWNELFLAEPEIRETAVSILSALQNLHGLLLGMFYLPIASVIGHYGMFWIFGGIAIVSMVIFIFLLPETKPGATQFSFFGLIKEKVTKMPIPTPDTDDASASPNYSRMSDTDL